MSRLVLVAHEKCISLRGMGSSNEHGCPQWHVKLNGGNWPVG